MDIFDLSASIMRVCRVNVVMAPTQLNLSWLSALGVRGMWAWPLQLGNLRWRPAHDKRPTLRTSFYLSLSLSARLSTHQLQVVSRLFVLFPPDNILHLKYSHTHTDTSDMAEKHTPYPFHYCQNITDGL